MFVPSGLRVRPARRGGPTSGPGLLTWSEMDVAMRFEVPQDLICDTCAADLGRMLPGCRRAGPAAVMVCRQAWLNLDGAVAAGGLDELAGRPAGLVFDPRLASSAANTT
jgi:hypothetical protein